MTRLSPQALVALEEALRSLYWYKGDLRRFVSASVDDPRILSQLNWEAPKRETVASLIGLLTENERHGEILARLVADVISFSDFRHLLSLEDGERLSERARTAVQVLAAHVPEATPFLKPRPEKGQHLERLREEFCRALSLSADQAQKPLQNLLGELFVLSGLLLTRVWNSFRAVEATFTLAQNDYGLSMTWDRVTILEALDRFLASLGHGKEFGLFVSLMGFAPEAVSAHSRGRPPFVLMDGADLMAVLEGRVGLGELILRKRRHAEATGSIFLSVQEVLKVGPSAS